MARIGAAQSLICAVMCLWVAMVVPVGASSARPRTPAEIELRKAAVAERLAVIEVELGAIETRLEGLPAHPAEADTDPDLSRQRQDLEARHGALADEKATLLREQTALELTRTRNATGPLQPSDPQGLSPLDLTSQSGQVSSGQAFNPAISVIPDIAYYYDDAGGDAADAGLERGFNLREMEVAFSGAVDPYFDVWATLAVGTDSIEAEEVYVQTRKLLPGLQLRVGKFLSGVGYVNKQHPHQWDFADQALPYEALLGGNLAETGLQVTWLPALPFYAQLGFEALQGDNERISQQVSDEHPDLFEAVPGPRLFTGFLKIAPDVGYSHAVQGGVSFGQSRSHQEAIVHEDGLLDEGLDGTSWFMGTDWVWRYDSARPFGRGDLTVQGEYLYRRKNLERVVINSVVIADGSRRVFAQDGLYLQAVYGIAQRWTVGGRMDVIGLTNRVEGPGDTIEYNSSRRYSAALTFNPTEFSRVRVQYAAGDPRTIEPARFNQVFVQFQMSLGVHGAHRF